MCGRFTQQRSDAELAELFDAEPLSDDPGGHYNVAPTDAASVVVEKGERRAVARYRWGLIPHWATDPSIGSRLINARAETLASSNAFRDSLAHRRCIVPTDGFYEWRRADGTRQPFLIAAADGSPLALAGLWSGWRDPATDEIRRTFTIVTTAANEFMAPIHDRMPIVLPRHAWATWLDPGMEDLGEVQAILAAATEADLSAHPVAPLVNNVRNDGPALVVPLDETADASSGRARGRSTP
ncbi:MAG: SOS response-associated peptidase [Chloroflexi bacterium]|nr:SOS response-associated peptidase [Chloroflexota bacterium]